ncbi:putative phenylacrylic acid decarboxylase [Pseudohyphozyma bogoriensis]|nr:putative phenylacrylic acid decarboxylase [Pseudohyphozyma bogoriensis]
MPHPTMPSSTRPKRIVIAMTGATGAVYAIRLMQILRELEVETHLVLSQWAEETIKYETDYKPAELRAMADFSYNLRDQYAAISSGSFQHNGMIIVPCSMKTLAAVRTGYADDLIARAADVTLKERRKLVMVVRETPLSDIHLDNMLSLTRSGAIIFPPVPAFYTKPETIDDMVDQSVGRMLDMFGFEWDGFERWDNGSKKKH